MGLRKLAMRCNGEGLRSRPVPCRQAQAMSDMDSGGPRWTSLCETVLSRHI